MFKTLFNLLIGIVLLGGAVSTGELNWVTFLLGCLGLGMMLTGLMLFMRQLGNLFEQLKKKSP